ncbi:MAG: threonine synthase, partial [Clostridia bacterium]|nr:threonine synthase [Clostridia bacterium]
VGKLVCASNINNVLTTFIETGVYDANLPFHNTMAPSIDILVSSNLERLLYMLSGDSEKVASYMKSLKENGKYEVDSEILKKVKESFVGFYSNEDEVAAAIKEVYEKYNYLIDTHTAVSYCAAKKFKGENRKVILSTASPYKFSKAVYKAIDGTDIPDDLDTIDKLNSLTGVPAPKPLKDLKSLEVRFNEVVCKDDAERVILEKLMEMENML